MANYQLWIGFEGKKHLDTFRLVLSPEMAKLLKRAIEEQSYRTDFVYISWSGGWNLMGMDFGIEDDDEVDAT